MGRVDVVRTDDRLTLALTPEENLLGAGCILGFSFMCITSLWLLLLIKEAEQPRLRGFTNTFGLFDPTFSFFGYICIIGLVVLLAIVPMAIVKATRPVLVFSFLRDRGEFLRDGKPVAPLKRIERLLIRRMPEPEGECSYRLIVVYLDGHEMALHDGYDELEVWKIADEIAAFVEVPVVYRD